MRFRNLERVMMLMWIERRETVTEAAKWLDSVWPAEELGPWYEVVDVGRLALDSACRCVCGQLGAAMAAHEGYDLRGSFIDLAEGIDENRYTDGYRLFMRNLGDHITTAEESRLIGLLRKRLGVDEDDGRVVPGEVMDAFAASTPTSYWVEEIETRRKS